MSWTWGISRVEAFFSELVGQHRRQPLCVIAALLLVGIVCGYRFGQWPLALGGAAVCTGLLMVRRRGFRIVVAASLVFSLGWGRAAWDRAGRAEEAAGLGTWASRQTFVCRVASEPVVTPLKGSAAKYVFSVDSVRPENRTEPLHYLPIQVQWFGAHASEQACAPRFGEVWQLTGRATLKKGRGHLLSLTMNSGEDRSKRLAEADSESWAVRIAGARRQAARRVTIGTADWGVVPALDQAMLLGCRGEMPPAMRRVFANSGTIHVFAISGLHIALVATVLTLLVSVLGVPRPYWVVGVVPLLIFYTVATGARPSAIRACMMAVLYFAAPLLGRKPNGLAALLGTALIVFVRQPWLVFDIGCVLSFVVMGGLVVFCRPFCAVAQFLCGVPRLELRARLLEAAGAKIAARRVQFLRVCAKFLADSFAVSLAAWLSSVPLTAYYFGRFTPGGLFANLIIAPCAFMVVVSGCLGLAASFVSAWIASSFNHAAGFFTVVMIRTAEVTAGCPWGNFRVSRWAPWMVWLWFVSLAALAVWLFVRQTKRNDGLDWLERNETEH